MQMKKFPVTLRSAFAGLIAIAGLCITVSAPVAAQKAPPKASQTSSRDAALKKMAKDLNLSAAQQSKIKKLGEDYKPKFTAVQKNKSLSAEQRRQKVGSLMMDLNSKFMAILTPQQKQKMMNKAKANAAGAGHENHAH